MKPFYIDRITALGRGSLLTEDIPYVHIGHVVRMKTASCSSSTHRHALMYQLKNALAVS
jgi:hypothetical protein